MLRSGKKNRDVAEALHPSAEEQHGPSAASPGASEEPVELDDEQLELVARYHLPPELVTRVRGGSWAERCEDAKRLAKLVREEPSEDQGRQRLREQLGTALEAKAEANRTLGEMLHGGDGSVIGSPPIEVSRPNPLPEIVERNPEDKWPR
jgi:hypothetical protein